VLDTRAPGQAATGPLRPGRRRADRALRRLAEHGQTALRSERPPRLPPPVLPVESGPQGVDPTAAARGPAAAGGPRPPADRVLAFDGRQPTVNGYCASAPASPPGAPSSARSTGGRDLPGRPLGALVRDPGRPRPKMTRLCRFAALGYSRAGTARSSSPADARPAAEHRSCRAPISSSETAYKVRKMRPDPWAQACVFTNRFSGRWAFFEDRAGVPSLPEAIDP
jgi:hypothetical protein